MCFILRLAPRFVASARAVLLSALACIRNDSPISFRIACAKSTQLTVHPKHTVLILRWTRQKFPVLDIRSSGDIGQRNTENKTCFSSSLGHQPVSIRVSRDLFQGLVQINWFQYAYFQEEIQFKCSFQIQISQCFLGTCQVWKCW